MPLPAQKADSLTHLPRRAPAAVAGVQAACLLGWGQQEKPAVQAQEGSLQHPGTSGRRAPSQGPRLPCRGQCSHVEAWPSLQGRACAGGSATSLLPAGHGVLFPPGDGPWQTPLSGCVMMPGDPVGSVIFSSICIWASGSNRTPAWGDLLSQLPYKVSRALDPNTT